MPTVMSGILGWIQATLFHSFLKLVLLGGIALAIAGVMYLAVEWWFKRQDEPNQNN